MAVNLLQNIGDATGKRAWRARQERMPEWQGRAQPPNNCSHGTLRTKLGILLPNSQANAALRELMEIKERTEGRVRKSGSPEFDHIARVTLKFAAGAKLRGKLTMNNLLVAAHHESIEDGLFTEREIYGRLGKEGLANVYKLTHAHGISISEYVGAYLPPIIMDHDVRAIKKADIIENLGELVGLEYGFMKRTMDKGRGFFGKLHENRFASNSDIALLNLLASKSDLKQIAAQLNHFVHAGMQTLEAA